MTHAAGTDLLTIPSGLHPRHTAVLEEARQLIGLWSPKSFPDLAIFLRSQGWASRAEREYWSAGADRLSGDFPGFVMIASFAHRLYEGYGVLATRADTTWKGFKELHRADMARYDNPRVNETFADVKRYGHANVAPMQLSSGEAVHGIHTLLLHTIASNLDGYDPGELANDDDKVQDLRWWLRGLGPLFETRARFGLAFSNRLLIDFPAETEVKNVYDQFTLGYAALADYGGEMATAYENRNPHDVARRDEPKPQEEKRDVGNTAMTHT